jgi:hypothetical protein
MLDYIVLAPKIEDLERRLIAVAQHIDAQNAEVIKHINDLKDRVAELEKARVDPASPVSTGTTTTFPATFLGCPRCGGLRQVLPTGNILTSMPPQTEVKCVGCGLTRGVQ